MPIVDITILIFILFWSIVGLFKGFIAELIALICWSSAIYFSANYFYIPSDYIMTFINSVEISNIIAFIGDRRFRKDFGADLFIYSIGCQLRKQFQLMAF